MSDKSAIHLSTHVDVPTHVNVSIYFNLEVQVYLLVTGSYDVTVDSDGYPERRSINSVFG